MKNSLIAFALMFSAATAFACESPEAQFIGNVTSYDKNDCTYKITYTQYNESGVCGLHSDDAESAWFVDASCSLKNGTEVSGYLIMKDDRVVIDE